MLVILCSTKVRFPFLAKKKEKTDAIQNYLLKQQGSCSWLSGARTWRAETKVMPSRLALGMDDPLATTNPINNNEWNDL